MFSCANNFSQFPEMCELNLDIIRGKRLTLRNYKSIQFTKRKHSQQLHLKLFDEDNAHWALIWAAGLHGSNVGGVLSQSHCLPSNQEPEVSGSLTLKRWNGGRDRIAHKHKLGGHLNLKVIIYLTLFVCLNATKKASHKDPKHLKIH